ncbi:MAG TPA: hypothetical protein VJT82_05085 [Pyrinomonadaceae bacterium]|nr:hypothetical protein [Pyrinomonadaceae bacterium]
MKDLKKILVSGLFLLSLSACTLAAELQKEKPPPKDPKVFVVKEKPPREEPKREKPREDKKGKPED